MANKPVNIRPQTAPKLMTWYYKNKNNKHFTIQAYFTVAVRYYIATNIFLRIGSIPSIDYSSIQSLDNKEVRIYISKTDDVSIWLKGLKDQNRKAIEQITYILENSITIDENEVIPPIVELDMELDRANKGIIPYNIQQIPIERSVEQKSIENNTSLKLSSTDIQPSNQLPLGKLEEKQIDEKQSSTNSPNSQENNKFHLTRFPGLQGLE
jgi:hypothetical protein